MPDQVRHDNYEFRDDNPLPSLPRRFAPRNAEKKSAPRNDKVRNSYF
jgi:hypothetical protein